MTPETRAARDRIARFLDSIDGFYTASPEMNRPGKIAPSLGNRDDDLTEADLRLVLAELDRHERATDPSTWREPCNVALAHTNGEIRCQLAVSDPPPARYTGNRSHWEKHWHQDEHGQVRTWTDNESEQP